MRHDLSLFRESRILGCGFAQHMRKRKTSTLHNMGSTDANRERVKKCWHKQGKQLVEFGERVWDRYPKLAPSDQGI